MCNILIADDVEAIRFAYELILCAQGHVVVSAKDGLEASSLLETIDFDLVVTDIMMPKSDGFELAARAHRMKKCPKIIAITGNNDYVSPYGDEDLFDATLTKPVHHDELLETVNSLLQQKNPA